MFKSYVTKKNIMKHINFDMLKDLYTTIAKVINLTFNKNTSIVN